MKLNFVCPECGGTELEEVCELDTVTKEVTGIAQQGDDVVLQYGTVTEGEIIAISFNCANCGHVLYDEQGEEICDVKDLIAWLRDHVND